MGVRHCIAGAFFALTETALLAQVPQLPPGGYKAGFPVTISGGKTSHGRPAIADLGLTPGHKSIIFGTAGHKLYVVLYTSFLAPGMWPVTLPGDVLSSPAIGDLDGDGIPDIVVGYGSTLESPSTGGVRAFKRDGTMLWDRPSGDFNGDLIPDPVVSTPAIGDVDGDGLNEVAWGSLDAHVYLVRGADGVDKPGWPRYVRDTIFSSPALHDIEGDGKLDVIIGVDAHFEGTPYNTPDGGCLHVFRPDGAEVFGFPQCVDQVLASAPAVGDIDGDGKPEIVIGTGVFYSNRAHKVYAFKCNGTAVPGWPVSVDGQVSSAPALADLDGDGVVDVIVTDDNSGPSGTFHVYAFKGTGALLWSVIPKNFFGSTLNAGDPIVADILGDSKPEVIVPTNTELCVISSTGAQLTDNGTHAPGSFSFFTQSSLSGGAVADFEPDNVAIEVVAVSASPSASDTQVYVWTPKATTGIPPWGMYRQSAARNAVVPGSPSCAFADAPMVLYPLTPCRILDTRNSTGPYGGPAIQAQRIRTFFVLGVCGIPPDARALSVNLTSVNSTGTGGNFNGQLRLFGGMGPSPNALVLLYSQGQTRASAAMVRLGAGQVSIQNDQFSGTTDVILDVSGYLK
jgi:hypothetical protein